MELNVIFKYISAVWHEIVLRKFKALLLASLVSFVVLAIGIILPSMFSAEVTIYADTQNVIKPLLAKQTAITNVKESRTSQVRDIIYSPRQLNKLIDNIYGKTAFSSASNRNEKIAELRKTLQVEGMSSNYIKISYRDNNADMTFRLLNKAVSLFIEDSANSKRDESRSAFNFIEKQVASYKEQLLLAEDKLKRFKSTHLDGTEAEVESRISTLRNDIENMKIASMESLTRISSLKRQLRSQDKFSSNDYEAALYHNRLRELQQNLDNLLLSYKDDYPGVIEIKYQINDTKKSIANLGNKEIEKQGPANEFNPLYTELSSKLSTAQVEHTTINNRLNAFEEILEKAYQRRKRVADNQAELSELNRDNAVIKNLYEDMLSNKEKARLSMVLDIQGQGVNYKVQEPAVYPTEPSGPRFLHFLIAGPILGMLFLVGIIICEILFDNKIRFASQLSSFEGVPLLISINHTMNSSERKKQYLNNIASAFFLLCFVVIYVSIALTHRYEAPILDVLRPVYSQLMELMR